MNNGFDLTGKVAIVTGASRGIGQAIAECYAGAGAKVVLSSRKQEGLNSVVEAIRARGGEAIGIAAHNGDKTALQALAQKTIETFGRVDILVNNAATNPHFGALLDAEDSLWQKTIEVNIMGMVWLTQAVVPVLRQNGGGKIINVASINGLRPGRLQGIYSMTKAVVISLTQTLAMELGINEIHLGVLMTDNMEIGMITPPVGLNLYVASGISRLGLTETTKAFAPWILVMLAYLILITYVPEISLWLPRVLGF
jgi:NAD(P)-dependent dehydrogenase (short-subunit alcohol dehydrogenase family)